MSFETQAMPSDSAIERRLTELGYDLPETPKPLASYVPAVISGSYVYTAGQLPLVSGELLSKGKVGDDIFPEEATTAATQCALNALAAIKGVLGNLDRIQRVVKVTGFIASAPGFVGQPAVLNGASEFLGKVFGEAGIHARSAVGVAELPLGAPVEVELLVEFA